MDKLSNLFKFPYNICKSILALIVTLYPKNMTDKAHSHITGLLNFFSRQPLQFSRFIAKILAAFVNALHITKTSETIGLNVQICLPDLSKQRQLEITRAAIRNELQSYMEFFNIWGSSNLKNISRIHQIQGEHYFHEALAEKKGLILIVPHFGTWEIMNAWFAQYTEMTIMYKPIKNDEANQFVRRARSREQAILVPTDESGVRQIFKALKQGGTTVILPDHSPKHGGDNVDYFGIPLASSSLSAKLIQKTKARALLLYALRNDNNGFDMFIKPMDERIYDGTAIQGTKVIHETLEHLVKLQPEHYHWSYKRFNAHPKLKGIYDLPRDQAIERVKQVRAESAESALQP